MQDSDAHDTRLHLYNEMLSVEADRHTLFLKPMMGHWPGSSPKLPHEGAAEQWFVKMPSLALAWNSGYRSYRAIKAHVLWRIRRQVRKVLPREDP